MFEVVSKRRYLLGFFMGRFKEVLSLVVMSSPLFNSLLETFRMVAIRFGHSRVNSLWFPKLLLMSQLVRLLATN